MKGCFNYDGINIRYKFKIIKYTNHDFLGECQVWYKTKPWQVSSNTVRFDEGRYNALINNYSSKSDSEILKIIHPHIIQDIIYTNNKNRFK